MISWVAKEETHLESKTIINPDADLLDSWLGKSIDQGQLC